MVRSAEVLVPQAGTLGAACHRYGHCLRAHDLAHQPERARGWRDPAGISSSTMCTSPKCMCGAGQN